MPSFNKQNRNETLLVLLVITATSLIFLMDITHVLPQSTSLQIKPIVIIVSIILQITAAIMALRLISVAGREIAWTIFSITFILMTVRRLLGLLESNKIIPSGLLSPDLGERLALLISILLVIGIYLIRKVFIDSAASRTLLKESEDIRFAVLMTLENSVIVSETDEKGNIIYVNQKFVDISQYSREELIGQNHRILKSGHQPQELFVDLWATISSGKIWHGEIKNRAKDGGYYWVDATIVPILGIDGKPEKYVAMRIVITEKKQLEEDLKKRINEIEKGKAEDEALLASLGEGIITTDKTGKITMVNHATEKILGWRSDELVGKQMTEIIQGLDENDKVIPREKRAVTVALLTGKEIPTVARQYVGKSGKHVPVSGTISPIILDKKLIGTAAVFRDTTRESEIEKTRRDILSLASHQLRTPLSGTAWLIETLKRGVHGPLNAGQTEYIDELYKINARMTALVHDMLDVLRLEGNTDMPKTESVSIKKVLSNTLELLTPSAKEKLVTFHFTEEGEDLTIDTNMVVLKSIFENLISNAINYSKDGSAIEIKAARKDSELVVSIKDLGIGIPKDEQARIFERFYRASNAKTFDTHGTGLGLYTASTLSKKIGAHISFESEAGKGSTFYVHIPLLSAGVLPESSTNV